MHERGRSAGRAADDAVLAVPQTRPWPSSTAENQAPKGLKHAEPSSFEGNTMGEYPGHGESVNLSPRPPRRVHEAPRRRPLRADRRGPDRRPGPFASPPQPRSPVHRRGWCNLYAALAKGRIDDGDVRELLARYPLAEGGSPVYAVEVRTNTPTISQEAFRTICRTKGRTSENSVKRKFNFVEFPFYEVGLMGPGRSYDSPPSRICPLLLGLSAAPLGQPQRTPCRLALP